MDDLTVLILEAGGSCHGYQVDIPFFFFLIVPSLMSVEVLD